MHAVIRQWSGATPLIEAMESRRGEVQQIIGGVRGFVAYYAVRDGDRLTSITVCEDRAGTEESTRRAGQWVRDNLPGVSLAAPEIREGEAFISFGAATPSLGSAVNAV
ncbi:hypothetical protein J421_3705 [Gemmatirosa kalamazoonensis]|uniref:Antibiotic biosynthesis monooxygenase n=1 Tax=Gemmatirosa kalamazoonensis TaxID=861299 RepID=W0RLD2_9BACT|nr:hypothetical protein [Gemmatirosa kalamazoonensis]AHG91242.1 hypothetical protein J421_3705 [Gemmatirosa kalamazoonensis]